MYNHPHCVSIYSRLSVHAVGAKGNEMRYNDPFKKLSSSKKTYFCIKIRVSLFEKLQAIISPTLPSRVLNILITKRPYERKNSRFSWYPKGHPQLFFAIYLYQKTNRWMKYTNSKMYSMF